MNTRRQGAVGIGRAIAYYSAKGYAVFVPVSDVSRFDLVVDTGEQLLRVEVKTTSRDNGTTQLRTYTWSGEVKRVSTEDCDIVFIVNLNTGTEHEYPSAELHGRANIRVS